MESYAQATVNAPVYTDEARDYLLHRLYDVRCTHYEKLHKDFNTDGFRPKDAKEMAKWLKEGFYTVKTPKEDDEDEADGYFYWDTYFSWGKEKPDMKGYRAASVKLEEKYEDAKTTVYVVTDEAARLKALEDFKAATFH